MHDLIPITPLGARAPRIDAHGPVTLTEVCDTALASVAARRGQEAATRAMIERATGNAVPGPGRATGGEVAAFWMGPDQWMIEAPFQSHEDLAARLFGSAKGCASVTEQTDAWCRFDLNGEKLREIFALLCPIDMRNWTGGQATRTSIDHLGCFVLCRAPGHFTVYGPRSSAGSLHHALLTAAVSAL